MQKNYPHFFKRIIFLIFFGWMLFYEGQACRRVKDKIRKDKKLARKISKIEKKIKA